MNAPIPPFIMQLLLESIIIIIQITLETLTMLLTCDIKAQNLNLI